MGEKSEACLLDGQMFSIESCVCAVRGGGSVDPMPRCFGLRVFVCVK